MRHNLVLTGLGGQGIIFAGRLLSQMALTKGWPVIGAETHGMAQRGGSVVAHLRFGGYQGSLVPAGQADALLAFKENEAYRILDAVKPSGLVFINAPAFPRPEVRDYVQTAGLEGLSIDADFLAVENGLPRSVNLIFLGFVCASGRLPFSLDELIEAVKNVTPPARLEGNLKAVELGAQKAGRSDVTP